MLYQSTIHTVTLIVSVVTNNLSVCCTLQYICHLHMHMYCIITRSMIQL